MKTRLNVSMRYAEQIRACWTVFLLSTLFHTQIALMPLFHGLSVTESHIHDYVDPDTVFWFMMIFFLIPMGAIAAAAFNPPRRYRVFHFWLTVIYTVFNVAHLIADIVVKAPGYQLVLMAFIVFIGLILNQVGDRWMRIDSHAEPSLRTKA